MFTLRFMQSKSCEETVVEAARYDKHFTYVENSTEKKCSQIIIYPQITSNQGGVEFRVGGEHHDAYACCFIENSAGKTIDRIGPFKADEERRQREFEEKDKRKPMVPRTNMPQNISSRKGVIG